MLIIIIIIIIIITMFLYHYFIPIIIHIKSWYSALHSPILTS